MKELPLYQVSMAVNTEHSEIRNASLILHSKCKPFTLGAFCHYQGFIYLIQ
jgi:hypothetical protein